MAAIIDVHETAESPRMIYSLDGQRRFDRILFARYDEELDDPSVLIAAIPFYQAPKYESFSLGEPFSWDLGATTGHFATCTAITPVRSPIHRNEWTITYTYESGAASDNRSVWYWDPATQQPEEGDWIQDLGDPWTQRPLVDIDFTLWSRPVWQSQKVTEELDASNNPQAKWKIADWGSILNSAGDVGYSDPPPHRDEYRMRVVLERNVASFDIKNSARLINSVNEKRICLVKWRGLELTIDPFEGKIAAITPEVVYRGNEWHLRVRYEFDLHIIPLEFKNNEIFSKRLMYSWINTYVDAGLADWSINKTPEFPEDGEEQGLQRSRVPIDVAGSLNLGPKLLDGQGNWLKKNPDDDPQKGRTWDINACWWLNFCHYSIYDWHDNLQWPTLTDLFPVQQEVEDQDLLPGDNPIANTGPLNLQVVPVAPPDPPPPTPVYRYPDPGADPDPPP